MNYCKHRQAITCLLLLLIVISAALPAIAQQKPKYNILFIAVDDMTERVGFLGNTEPVSPNIQRLLNRGMAFNLAYCQHPVCSPSRTSLLSGWRPDKTGIFTNHKRPRSLMSPDVKFLPEYFMQYGYEAERYGKIMHTLFEDDITWDYAIPPAGGKDDKSSFDPDAKSSIGPNWWIDETPDSLRPQGEWARRLVTRMQQPLPQRFFYALGVSTHHPFTPSLEYWNLNGDPSVKELLPINSAGTTTDIKGNGSANISIPYSPPGDRNDAPSIAFPYQEIISKDEMKRVMHAYDGEVAQMDAQLGLVLDELDRQRLWDNTVVVFWSDHGQHFGEHEGLWGKSTLFEESLHIPLIICVPGRPAGACNRLVELVDIYPTLAELCGLPAPQGMEGTSLVPLLDNPELEWKKAVFSQVATRVGIMGRSVTTDRYRYNSWDTAGEELYDHLSDPNEYTNQVTNPAYKEILDKLRNILAGGWQKMLPPKYAKQTLYRDADKDGFGNAKDSILAYALLPGYCADNHDCNDRNVNIHPGAMEKQCNGIDDNCNLQVDENKPVPEIDVAGSPDICISGGAILTVKGRDRYSYQWKKDGIDIPGATQKRYTATAIGTYTVSMIADNCSSASRPVRVTSSCSAIKQGTVENAMKVPSGLLVHPNPSKGIVSARFSSSSAGTATIRVYDIAGKTVFTKTEKLIKGFNSIQLALKELAAGLYQLEISNGGARLHSKLVIEK